MCLCVGLCAWLQALTEAQALDSLKLESQATVSQLPGAGHRTQMLWESKQLSSPNKSLVFKLQLAGLLSVISMLADYDFVTHIPSGMASAVE